MIFYQDFTYRLAGNKFLTKNLFQQFFKMKSFTPSEIISRLYDVSNWVTPGQAQSCLQFIWNFYYDSTKQLQADNCIIITSKYVAW